MLFIRIKNQFIHRNFIEKDKLNNVDNLTLKSLLYQLRKTVKTPEWQTRKIQIVDTMLAR